MSLTLKNTPRYAFSTGEHDQLRLEILNEVYNPQTLSFLSKNIQTGMSVADIGCGLGIVSAELSQMVGPQGKVTGIDLSSEQLLLAKIRAEALGLRNINFILASAYDLSSLQERFDAVYCRFLLIHLHEPIRAIEQFISILDKKGALLLEEMMGLHTFDCLPQRIPVCEELSKIALRQYEIQQSNPSFGRLLPDILKNKGLSLDSMNLFHPILKTSREKSLIRLGLESRRRVPGYGNIEQSLCERLKSEIEENPDILLLYPEIIQVAANRK